MQLFVKIFTILSFMTMPVAAMAHGYWLETEGNHMSNQPVTIKMYYGDYPAGEKLSGRRLDKMKDIKVYLTSTNGTTQEIPMTQTPDYWEGKFTPQAKGIYTITGINDSRDVQDWTKHGLGVTRPVQYLKTLYQVGNATNSQSEQLFLDMEIKNTGNSYEAEIFKKGKNLAGQRVVITGYGTDMQVLETSKKGEVNFRLAKVGLYIISIDWTDTKPGKFNGKPYTTVRHRLDYSFYK